jgi:hypothetical protein
MYGTGSLWFLLLNLCVQLCMYKIRSQKGDDGNEWIDSNRIDSEWMGLVKFCGPHMLLFSHTASRLHLLEYMQKAVYLPQMMFCLAERRILTF